MTRCVRVLYRGRVQGVGFRYRTQTLAHRFAVAGYVKNLPDGRVEVVAEGDEVEVCNFLDAVADTMAELIVEQREETIDGQQFRSFDIRYD